jgi:hypothetical protein
MSNPQGVANRPSYPADAMRPLRRAASGFAPAQSATVEHDPQERGGATWLVNCAGDETVEMTQAELLQARRDGDISEGTLVWRQGLSEWTPVEAVPQLAIVGNGAVGATEPGRGEPFSLPGQAEPADAPPEKEAGPEDEVTELPTEQANAAQGTKPPLTISHDELDAEVLSEDEIVELPEPPAKGSRDSEPSLTIGYDELDDELLLEDEVTGVWAQNAQQPSPLDVPAVPVPSGDSDLDGGPAQEALVAPGHPLAGTTEDTPTAAVSYADLARTTWPEGQVPETQDQDPDASEPPAQFAPPHLPYASHPPPPENSRPVIAAPPPSVPAVTAPGPSKSAPTQLTARRIREIARRETVPSIARTAELEAALAAAKRLRQRQGLTAPKPARHGAMQFLLDGFRGFRDALGPGLRWVSARFRAAARWLASLRRPARPM